jgi:hypothetical protein
MTPVHLDARGGGLASDDDGLDSTTVPVPEATNHVARIVSSSTIAEP